MFPYSCHQIKNCWNMSSRSRHNRQQIPDIWHCSDPDIEPKLSKQSYAITTPSSSKPMVLAHLSKSNSRTFKDFQGPYEGYIRRTKLTKTGTFISIYKQVQFDNLTPPSINQKLELWEKFTKCINSRLGGLRERRELPQQGLGRSPGRYRIFCMF